MDEPLPGPLSPTEPEDSVIQPGRVLGGFVIGGLLSRGGFGAVYRATQEQLGREAVVKVLHARHRSNRGIIERFRREAQLASRLEHPYNAHIYAFGAEPDGLLWIAMELVRGTSLAKLLRVQGPLPLERLVPLIEKICEVVHTAHEHGIIHRDLKPPNVMVLARAGQLLPKLLDFGLAKDFGWLASGDAAALAARRSQRSQGQAQDQDPVASLGPSASLPHADLNSQLVSTIEFNHGQEATVGHLGSPHYMAPEQWRHAALADARTDIYALGALTYETLTGRPPFHDRTTVAAIYEAHTSAPIPLIGPAAGAATGGASPPALDEVLRKAMAKQPEDRFQSALEFAAAFRAAAGLGDRGTGWVQLDSVLTDGLLTHAPRPIAEAVASLAAARNVTQAATRMAKVERVVIRYLGLMALAGYGQLGAPLSGAGDEIVRGRREALMARLGEQGLSEAEWLELGAALCHPYASQRDAYPVPELVSLFFDEQGHALAELHDISQRLALLRQAVHEADASDEELRERIQHALPALALLLERSAFLADYPLALPDSDEAQLGHLLMGAVRARDLPLRLQGRRPVAGRLVLTSRDGHVLLSLWPLLEAAPPAPGAPEELFFFDSRGRGGTARLLALPGSFELHDEAPLTWLRTHVFVTDAEPVGETPASAKALDLASAHDTRPPYPGLLPFRQDDAAIFFGRDRETQSFLNRLQIQPLLAVVAPSGAGKSSFIHAGVLPGLPSHWRAVSVRPGAMPWAALASRLLTEGLATTEDVARFPSEPEALGRCLRAAAEHARRTLILVLDQFEELFTLVEDETVRRQVAQALALAAPNTDAPVRIVLTLRDDFLVRAGELPGLRDHLSQGLQLLGMPAREDLIKILTEPARLAGYHFEDPALPGEIVDAIQGKIGSLPLLAFTAARLWAERDREHRQLRRQAYEAMGGVGGALAQHAEALMASLGPIEQRLVRDIFRHLITSQGTRAAVTRAALYKNLGRGEVDNVLEHLIAARLLNAYEGELGSEQIELIHEALLAAWPRLVKWREEDVADARVREQLDAAARQWALRGRPAGLLWHGEWTAEYRRWRARSSDRLSDTEEAFAQASLALAERRRRLGRAVTGGVGALLILIIAFVSAQRAQIHRQLLAGYEERGREELLAGKPDDALVYLDEAYRGGNDTPSLRFLLGQALQHLLPARLPEFLGHRDRVLDTAFSPDGTRLATASADHTAELWDVATGRRLRTFAHDDVVSAVAFSPSGDRLITASHDGYARLFEIASGRLLRRMDGQHGPLHAAAPGRDNGLLAAGHDGVLRIWDMNTGALLDQLSGHTGGINAAGYDTGGLRIVSAGTDHTARLWDPLTRRSLLVLAGHSDSVNGAAFDPTGTLIVTASSDNTAKVWDTHTGRVVGSLGGHRSIVNSAAFSPDGSRIVTASVDHTAKVWDAQTGRLLASYNTRDAALDRAVFSPDGQLIALAGHDHSVRLWSTPLERRSPREVAELVAARVPLHLVGGRLTPVRAEPSQPETRGTPVPSRPLASAPVNQVLPPLHTYRFATVRIDAAGRVSERREGRARFYEENLGQGEHLDMVEIRGGAFLMGSQPEEGEGEEHPQHRVTVPPFFIGKYEVTQGQWKAVMNPDGGGHNPSQFVGDDLPVESVTWYEAVEFCERLSRRTGRRYRLPTEAEWEYACRGGSPDQYAFGPTIGSDLANFDGKNPFGAAPPGIYRRRTVPVGSLGMANPFGLYDVHGNVFEWCLDPFRDTYAGAPDDGSAWEDGRPANFRALRGGSWRWVGYYARSAYRRRFPPGSFGNDLGFRVVAVLPTPAQ
ncbi:MAG TPA: SUMF1/EgtB/PvdO family nonheme iron enzyme [Polyangia bacterium]|nr:SUMF1/EgtB/PvdO family nonheme iron enzyme [Polyangia bacterium]